MFSAVSLPSMRIESHALEREFDKESKEAAARTTRRLFERRRGRAEETTADDDKGVAIGLLRRCIAACGGCLCERASTGLEDADAKALARGTVTPTRMVKK